MNNTFHILFILFILLCLKITSCTNSITETPIEVELPGEKISTLSESNTPIEVKYLLDGTKTIAMDSGSVYLFDCENYKKLGEGHWKYKIYMKEPSVDTLTLIQNTFKAKSNGNHIVICKLKEFDTTSIEDYKLESILTTHFTCDLKTSHLSVPNGNYTGQWYKCFENYSINDITTSNVYYSPRETDNILIIEPDSVEKWDIKPSTFTKSIHKDKTNFFLSPYFNNCNFESRNDSLYFYYNKFGFTSQVVFTRIHEDIDSLKLYEYDKITQTPDEFVGNWYLSRQFDFRIKGDSITDSDQTIFSSPSESYKIYKYEKEFITFYGTMFGLDSLTDTVSIEGFDYREKIQDGKLCRFFNLEPGWIRGVEYTKFTSQCPPQKWIDDSQQD